jgi:hypothetical protein
MYCVAKIQEFNIKEGGTIYLPQHQIVTFLKYSVLCSSDKSTNIYVHNFLCASHRLASLPAYNMTLVFLFMVFIFQ